PILPPPPPSPLFPYTTLFRSRLQQLPPAFPRADRRGEARRARRGRAAARVPDGLARRGVPQPDVDDVPQPDVDRRRGDDPRAAEDRKSTRLNSSHRTISYAVF